MPDDGSNPAVPGVHGLARHFTVDSLREYLLARCTRTDDGCLVIRGYGSQRGIYQKVAGRAWAHIAAYAVFVGAIDPALEVDHTCGAKDCIEPTHLRQLSHADNCRQRQQSETCRNGHPRELDPTTGRYRAACRVCNALTQKRWRERQAEERARSMTPDGLAASRRRWDALNG
ncbi:MAG: HNH endonuclease [Micromonosporaceae bacterium]